MGDSDMAMVFTMARGRLRPSLRPSPRPRLIPTSCTDMVLVTTDMDSDTMADITARGLLMLRPIPTFFTEDTTDMDMDSDTTDMDSDTMAMDLDTTDTARGLLMLRLIPTFCTEDTTVLDTDTVLDTPDTLDTADTSTANRLHQDLSVNHRLDLRPKWIVISLKFPSPVLQFQCYHTKSLVMGSR